MLEVGANSYVTVTQADEYILEFYLSTEKQRVAWEAMSVEDKEVCLCKACALIEQNMFNGIKTDSAQTLAFPRDRQSNVPLNIMYAQIEECIEIACPTAMREDLTNRTSAVSSYSIGHLSESYEKAVLGEVNSILASMKAQRFILPYTRGGFNVF